MRTFEPVSDKDLQETIETVGNWIVTIAIDKTELPASIILLLPKVRGMLIELSERRREEASRGRPF